MFVHDAGLAFAGLAVHGLSGKISAVEMLAPHDRSVSSMIKLYIRRIAHPASSVKVTYSGKVSAK